MAFLFLAWVYYSNLALDLSPHLIIYFCVRAARALVRLGGCAGSPASFAARQYGH